jgi:hypothetical protein
MVRKNSMLLSGIAIAACMGTAAQAQLHGRGTANKTPPPTILTDVPATTPNKDYPLKLHFLDGEAGVSGFSSVGVGSGNLLGEHSVGFDYTYKCDQGFEQTPDPEAFYQGKWKKQDKEIEILTKEPFSDKTHKCKLDVGMRTAPYTDDNKPPPLPHIQRPGRQKKN